MTTAVVIDLSVPVDSVPTVQRESANFVLILPDEVGNKRATLKLTENTDKTLSFVPVNKRATLKLTENVGKTKSTVLKNEPVTQRLTENTGRMKSSVLKNRHATQSRIDGLAHSSRCCTMLLESLCRLTERQLFTT